MNVLLSHTLVACFALGILAADAAAQSGTRPGGVGLNRTGNVNTNIDQVNRRSLGLQNNSINGLIRQSTQIGRGFGLPTFNNGLSAPNPTPVAPVRQAPARAQSARFGTIGNRPTSKPFTGVSNGPTVSPFLGLFDDNFDVNAVPFVNIVRPLQQQQDIAQQVRLQQQQTNRLQQQQSQASTEMNLRLQQLSARPAFNPAGSQRVAPTGHPTAFGNFLQYYPTGR